MEPRSCVCRLQLKRAMPSVVKAGAKLAMDVISSSEFNEPAYCSTAHTLQPRLSLLVDNEAQRFSEIDLSLQTECLSQGTVRIRWQVPPQLGKYSLRIRQDDNYSGCGCTIIPLETAPFTVVDETDYLRVGRPAMGLLNNFRTITCADKSIRIMEEYGSTIGSHIYDSSIIVIKHLTEVPDLISSVTADLDGVGGGVCSILELGAGCGVVGLWLGCLVSQVAKERTAGHVDSTNSIAGRSRCHIYLTDTKAQLPLLCHNASLNSHAMDASLVRVTCSELDWGRAEQIVAFRDGLKGEPLRLIVAGDVFYDKEAAKLCAQVVRQLATPGVTKVLVAQKLRKNADNVSVALIDEQQIRRDFGFESIALVRGEADVRLWLMTAS